MENSENKRPTQVARIKKYMQDFGSITTFEAFMELGVMRLGARISEMRKSGEKIGSTNEVVKNKYEEVCHIKRYFLMKA